MDVRGMLHSLMSKRPDIIERQAQFALLEATRRVCQETLLLQAVVTVPTDLVKTGLRWENYIRFSVPKNLTPGILATDPDSETLAYKVLRIMDVTLTPRVGDTIFPKPLPKSELDDIAFRRKVAPDPTVEPPEWWADWMGTLVIYPAMSIGSESPEEIVGITARVALQPEGEFEYVDLPAEAGSAITEFALADIFEIAGKAQSYEIATHHRNRAINLCGMLRDIARVGSSGRPGARETSMMFSMDR